MARLDSVVKVDKNISTTTLATITATAALAIGERKLVSFCGTGPINYLLGDSAVAAAAATDPMIPGNVMFYLNTGPHTHVRIFNPGASTITYSVVTYHNN